MLTDQSQTSLAKGLAAINSSLERLVKKGNISTEEANTTLKNIQLVHSIEVRLCVMSYLPSYLEHKL
jgi:3-hydroxyacyl-CoA dehydrogenase